MVHCPTCYICAFIVTLEVVDNCFNLFGFWGNILTVWYGIGKVVYAIGGTVVFCIIGVFLL